MDNPNRPRPFPRRSTPMPAITTRPEQTTREGLEQLSEVVAVQASDGLTLEDQVRKLQKEQLDIRAEMMELRRLIGSAEKRDEEHADRLARLEEADKRHAEALAEVMSRIDGAVSRVDDRTDRLEQLVNRLAAMVEASMKGFSLRSVLLLLVFALCSTLGGALVAYIQAKFR
jgi:chromosome segregation ATPase